jgi:hypothetical protein
MPVDLRRAEGGCAPVKGHIKDRLTAEVNRCGSADHGIGEALPEGFSCGINFTRWLEECSGK